MKHAICCWVVMLLASVSLGDGLSDVDPYLGYKRSDAIVIGEVLDVKMAGENGRVRYGVLTLSISDIVRGGKIDATLKLPYRFRPTDAYDKQPPALCERLEPKKGMVICALIAKGKGELSTQCLLNMQSSDREVVPVLRKMTEVETLSGETLVSRLLELLAGSSPLLRTFAMDELVSRVFPDAPEARKQALRILMAIARDKKNSSTDDRMQIISMLGCKLFDGHSTNSPVNAQIISGLVELAADSVVEIRSEAVQILYAYFYPSVAARTPEADDIAVSDKDIVRQALERDIAEKQHFAEKAKKVLAVVEKMKRAPAQERTPDGH